MWTPLVDGKGTQRDRIEGKALRHNKTLGTGVIDMHFLLDSGSGNVASFRFVALLPRSGHSGKWKGNDETTKSPFDYSPRYVNVDDR